MVRIITDAVLIPEFSGDLIQGILDLVSAVFTRTSGNQPGLASAGIGKRIEHIHVNRVLIDVPGIAAATGILLRHRRRSWIASSAGIGPTRYAWDPGNTRDPRKWKSDTRTCARATASARGRPRVWILP